MTKEGFASVLDGMITAGVFLIVVQAFYWGYKIADVILDRLSQ